MMIRNHTILCCLLAFSLVWLPFTVSADNSLHSTDNDNCQEMHSVMLDHTITDRSMNKSMMQEKCCDCCDHGCNCIDMSVCSNATGHTSVCIMIDRYLSQSFQMTQSMIEQITQYYSQIILPNFRPPIV